MEIIENFSSCLQSWVCLCVQLRAVAQHTGQAPPEDAQNAVQAKASEKRGARGSIFRSDL